MDVTCERCNTEYEFDDTLVSERGTTVKCTTCGHQFKVRRSDGVTAPERWQVRTVDGRELDFTALRELQAAMTQGRVSRDDVLARGGGRPRRLGSIAELEPFFAGTGGISMPSPSIAPGPPVVAVARSRTQTPAGLGIVPAPPPTTARFEGSVAIPLPSALRAAPRTSDQAGTPKVPRPSRRPVSTPPLPMPPQGQEPSNPPPGPGVVVSSEDAPPAPLPPPPQRAEPVPATIAHFPPPFMRTPSAPPPGLPPPSAERPEDVAEAAPVMPQMPLAAPVPKIDVAPPAPPENPMTATLPQGTPEGHARAALRAEAAERAPDPVEPGRPSTATPAPLTPTMGSARASFTDEADNEPHFSGPVASRRTGGARLIIGVLVAGCFLFLGATVGRKYLTAEARSGGGEAGGERIAALLRESDHSLQGGDLETANDDLVKASALGESDPRVAASLARLAAIRADQRWLAARLVPPGDADEAAAKRDLADALTRLKQATTRALALAPADPVVLRAQIDALRIAGDRDGARKLVGSLGSAASQPESALSLAAIDLVEDKPTYDVLIVRLRAAAASEQDLGRARAMLVYALARSGDFAGAKSELEHMTSLPRSNPLTKPLQTYVGRGERDNGSLDVGALPDGASEGVPSSYEECLRLAATAKKKGDLKRAETLYAAALQKHPGDSDAVAGLADVGAKKAETHPAKDHGGGAASPPPASRPSGAHHPAEDTVPDDYVAPQPSTASAEHPDTSDLPGVKLPPKATGEPPPPPPSSPPPSSPPPPSPPPGIDTSDLPGLK